MIRRLSMMALLTVILSACNLLAEVDMDKLELLNEANSEIVFLGSGGQKTVALVTNSEWTAESDATWCKVTPSQGTAEDAKVKLSVEANDKAQERTAVVTLSTANASIQINVIQREMKAILLEEADYVIEAEGETFEVELKHNVEYQVEFSPSVSWIREVKSKKMTKAVHEFEVKPNEDTKNRSVEILFVCEDEDIEEVVTVVQKGLDQNQDDGEDDGGDEGGTEESRSSFWFAVTSSGSTFAMPAVFGEFTGYVFWGDGTSSAFGAGLQGHEYPSDSEHTVEMNLSGNSEEFAVEFKDIKGLVKVDLSGL